MRNTRRDCNETFFAFFMPLMIPINRRITGREDDIEAQSYQPKAMQWKST